VSLRIRDLPSPNHDDRPPSTPIDLLILHYTDMRMGQEAIDRLRDPRGGVSVHYIVEEDGSVRLVPETRRAFHVGGASWWRGHTALNKRSVGIAIVNPGHELGYRDFPVLQLAAACDLCLDVLSHHPIPARNVVAHSDVAPHRRQDPGERFYWRSLAANGVGLWPEGAPFGDHRHVAKDAAQLRDARAHLAAIGYEAAPEGPLDGDLAAMLRAFQRHWRQEDVTGQPDLDTLARLEAVRRLAVQI